MAPIILSQPKSVNTKIGETITFEAKAAAIPEADFEWFKNGVAINGAKSSKLKINSVNYKDEATYSVVIKNNLGSLTSQQVKLTLE